MATEISRSDDLNIGRIFTPPEWAEWLIFRWGIFDAWIDGAHVCDPTAGRGAFALALFRIAASRRIHVTQELLSRLTLIEIHPPYLEEFKKTAFRELNIDFPSSQLFSLDITTIRSDMKYDILFGNLPWGNFADLPECYKEHIKLRFVSEGLVPDKRKVLLGSSRVDIASLVTKVVLGKMLRKGGTGCFYLPISLFSGDDAHRGFRDYIANRREFSVEEVYEFTETKIFKGIRTAYCCAKFRMDVQNKFPVRYFREIDRRWIEHRAIPLESRSDPWRILRRGECEYPMSYVAINVPSRQKPRQGVNTCGASSTFIFKDKPSFLPDQFLFPLVTKEIWTTQDMMPHKWILLPYDVNTGKPLSLSEIEEYPDLATYLQNVRPNLETRKGVLMQSYVRRGIWWSLLGVGPYSFAPYKVMWEAYGGHRLRPVVLRCHDGQAWQGNQAMHAYVPCWDEGEAARIEEGLGNPEITTLLKQMNGAGRRNWAQPGKIKKILRLRDDMPGSIRRLI